MVNSLGSGTQHLILDTIFKQSGNLQAMLESDKSCALTLRVGRDGITVSGGSIGTWEIQTIVDGKVVIG